MYTEEHVDAYDLIYEGRGKDYAAEASHVLALIRARAGEPSSLLDVACGTGGHLRYFVEAVARADGLELSPTMAAAARERAPDAHLHTGDMRGFDLGRTYTAVVCMFGSIGYMEDPRELGRALRAFARHVEPGGVVVVEPWWFPEDFIEGYIATNVVRDDHRVVARLSHSRRKGARAHMEMHFLVATPGSGVRYFVENHTVSLFRREEYETAFADAGLSVEFLADPSGPGRFLGVRR